MSLSRRSLLSAGLAAAASGVVPPAIARALAIAPDVREGSIRDVAHVVILMQENRGFDHYFGSMRGVRGFGDRLPIPIMPLDPATGPAPVWHQVDRTAPGGARIVAPFHLSTRADFEVMRMAGTPHTWPDAQAAWDDGRMGRWPEAKTRRAMGHYRREDLPFQYALADAFTLCDAYHCSVQTGTNTNRLFLWSGTNDPSGTAGGPAIGNSHDDWPEKNGPHAADPYRWTTIVERLQAAGVDWRLYQDMADNFSDNPLVGFAAFRAARDGHGDPALKERALTTRGLDALRADVVAGRLPQVSYVIATAAGSEHPVPSSPAQGAAYTAEVLDALTADPAIWARTALFVMFDENDGFFDHVPPPAPPARDVAGRLHGGSSVDLAGEHHLVPSAGDADVDTAACRGRAYGLGPRVPMYVVSPWSRGGWVNSQVFDHTSVTRFLEARFGIHDPNISAWRRTVCGDLTSAFDFTSATRSPPSQLPDPRADARRAAALSRQVTPDAPPNQTRPRQEPGLRRARPLPYRLAMQAYRDATGVSLRFTADGAGAVFHVYDRLDLSAGPRRYTVAAGTTIEDRRPHAADGHHDLWILGPNGFHRHVIGHRDDAVPAITATIDGDTLLLDIAAGTMDLTLTRLAMSAPAATASLTAGHHRLTLDQDHGWYDVTITSRSAPDFRYRLTGRADRDGRATTSDPFDQPMHFRA